MHLSRLANQVGRLSVVRILLAGLALVVAVIARDIIVGILGSVLALGRNTPRIWLGPPKAITDASAAAVTYSVSAFLVMVSVGFGAYWLYSRLIERRVPFELAWKTAPRELALGSLIGSGLVFAVVGVLAAFGYFRICGRNPWIAAVPASWLAATAAFMEELAVRGIVFRIIEQRLGRGSLWRCRPHCSARFTRRTRAPPGRAR